MNFYTMLECVTPFATEAAAVAALPGVAAQDGCVGARVLASGSGKPWRLQAFFDDAPGVALPDGVHRRSVPDSLLRALRAQDAS